MKVEKYLSEDQTEAIKAVQRINNEMHDKGGWENHCDLFSITICSYYYFISLDINRNEFDADIKIFNSENDNRIYYEKSDKYETFYSHIKRKFREIKSNIDVIKL